MSTATASGSKAMPCATRPERVAVILCGGGGAPNGAMLAQTRGRVQTAGFRLLDNGASEETGSSSAGEEAGLGPLGGILAAARACEDLDGSCLLAVPADMPLLNPRALQRLADIAEADGRGAVFDLGPLPMALVLSRELRQSLVQAVREPGSRSLIAVVNALGLPVVASLPDDGLDNLVTRRGDRMRHVSTFTAIPDHQGEST